MPQRSSREEDFGDGVSGRRDQRRRIKSKVKKTNDNSNKQWKSRSRSRGRQQQQDFNQSQRGGDFKSNEESSEFPPSTVSSRKSSLSNIFRTAFSRSGSGRNLDQKQQRDQPKQEQHNDSFACFEQQQHKKQSARNVVKVEQKPPQPISATTTGVSPDIFSEKVDYSNTKAIGVTQLLGSTKSKFEENTAHTSGIAGNSNSENDDWIVYKCNSQSSEHNRNSRLFYSNADDEDSEDSFESRTRSRSHQTEEEKTNSYEDDGTLTTYETNTLSKSQSSRNNNVGINRDTKRVRNNDLPSTTILRYRGFSTSIKSLFLDESLVCTSIGCFGLILSNRTEHLLQLRNDRRGVKWGRSSTRRTLPSRIVAYALILTLLLIGITFVIWGFGSNSDGRSFLFSFKNGGSGGSVARVNQGFNDDRYSDQGSSNSNNNRSDDDGGQNSQANDDAKQNVYDDDTYDSGNNDDAEGSYNQYYYQNDDAGGRNLIKSYLEPNWNPWNENSFGLYYSGHHHRLNGVFKLRDMKETIWEPTIDFLSDEWYRPYEMRRTSRRIAESYNRQRNESSSDESKRSLASDLRFSFFVAFLIVLGILGRRRRMRTRYYLVRARAQEDHLFYASIGTSIKRVGFQDSREDQYEGACSHTLFGIYPTDPPRDGDEIEDEVQVSEEGVSQRKKKPHHEDCVGRGFNCLLGLCCGFVCKCWFQCLSICALAQEAREIRLLVPTRYQQVDYITHQPFHEYQKQLKSLRRAGFMAHFNALSKLSKYILGTSISFISVLVATLLLNPRASFSWQDMTILSATFLQSFLIIWAVHRIFHKSDLSFDGIIKFFAAGFVIAVPSAFFFEGLLINLTLFLSYLVYSLGQLLGGDIFEDWITDQYGLLWLTLEIFNAYIVATVTEELCKYYTFRCVEHPDLLFLTGLVSSTHDERALEGGVVKYPFSSHQVQRTNMKNMYDDDASQYSRSSHRSKSSRGRSYASELNDDYYDCEEEEDVRTHRQKAAAVTTSMISVAVGLACAENFLYVFLMGGTGSSSSDISGYVQEWVVLLFRSIFPVHALAAAMQSVNMIRKFIEVEDVNGHRIGVGRIILPAVFMHGTFDAILLGINFFSESINSQDDIDDNESNAENSKAHKPVIVNIVAWLSVISVIACGFVWYYNEYHKQTLRLIELEQREKASIQQSKTGYSSPKSPSNVELV